MPRPSSSTATSTLGQRPIRHSYKLTPDGKVRWSYRRPGVRGGAAVGKTRFQPSADGIMGSPLVTDDTVYFADTGGWIYALDRMTGAERWKRNSRAADFPGAHPINVFFAGPFVARGKLIVAGGSLEQVISASPFYKGNSGRGFVAALEPKTGEVIWKYDVGPKPEPLTPPITIKDSFGNHVFYFGPGTSSVWSTPSFDAETGTIFFGTDVNTAPRRPTTDDPRPYTRESCAVIAIDVDKGTEKWVTQINPGDIWTNAMRSYDPKEGRYKDQAVGDTPKIYTILVDGKPVKVVGVGCKNGGFYVLKAADGRMLEHTPIYTGPPTYPLSPEPDRRMLALPSCIGGLQTGCATDGRTIFTNGIDALRLGSQEKPIEGAVPPTGGRVVAISLDTKTEAVASRAAQGRQSRRPGAQAAFTPTSATRSHRGSPWPTALSISRPSPAASWSPSTPPRVRCSRRSNSGPVWAGPSVSRGRIYIGTGNTLFSPDEHEGFFPKKATGVLYSFGAPGEDEVSRMGAGKE